MLRQSRAVPCGCVVVLAASIYLPGSGLYAGAPPRTSTTSIQTTSTAGSAGSFSRLELRESGGRSIAASTAKLNTQHTKHNTHTPTWIIILYILSSPPSTHSISFKPAKYILPPNPNPQTPRKRHNPQAGSLFLVYIHAIANRTKTQPSK